MAEEGPGEREALVPVGERGAVWQGSWNMRHLQCTSVVIQLVSSKTHNMGFLRPSVRKQKWSENLGGL